MTRVALCALLVLGACVDGGPDDSDTDTGSDGCPEGMHAASAPGLFISSFQIDGLTRAALFEDGEYRGRPAACIAEDGRSVDYIFLVTGEPFGRVFMDAPRGDESYDLNAATATVEVELFSDPATTFESGEWVSGSWFVSSVGATFDSDLSGSALDDDGGSHSLNIALTLQGSR